MRFPVRFTSDFQLGVAARILRTRGRQPLILRLAPFARTQTIACRRSNPLPSSMVWIGGAEPLEDPEIPKFTNALAASAREVFLQTDGKLFRRRVHEFQPSPRFRFAFHFIWREHQPRKTPMSSKPSASQNFPDSLLSASQRCKPQTNSKICSRFTRNSKSSTSTAL